MLGLQLNIKIRLYIPQTFSCLFLFHCTTTITNKCICAQIEKKLHSTTYFLTQAISLHKVHGASWDQSAKSRKSERWDKGRIFEIFPSIFYNLSCDVMAGRQQEEENAREAHAQTDKCLCSRHDSKKYCLRSKMLLLRNHISPCHYSLLYCIWFVLSAM